jgi:hypothetical protein
MFPCDLLIVHRDSEAQPQATRRAEVIAAALGLQPATVPVIPVRMMESWLLISEEAIRRASGNPNGANGLDLPAIATLETVPDPKAVLFTALKTASNLGARRRAKFDVHGRRRRVSECIPDFTVLRMLDSFRRFEEDIVHAIASI